MKIQDFPTLWKVIDRLEQASIGYMLTGSMAVNIYGHSRATNDFDIVIQVGPSDVRKLYNLFKKDCYVSEEAIQEAIQRQSMFNIIDNETIFKVDFIIAKDDAFSMQAFHRRREIKVDDKKIYVISPEDLILLKLEWSQASLSEMQERDIKNILRILGKSLDKPYLEKWATAKGMKSRLEKLYEQA